MAAVLVAPRGYRLPRVSTAGGAQDGLPGQEVSRFTSEYGQRVNLARRSAGLTQTELGDAVGLSRSSVANVEAGRQASTAEQVAQVAETLGFPAGWLLVGDSTWTPPSARLTRDQMRQIAAQLNACASTLAKAAQPPRRSASSVQFEHPDQKIHPPCDAPVYVSAGPRHGRRGEAGRDERRLGVLLRPKLRLHAGLGSRVHDHPLCMKCA
jgi:transcriptional regulator with XRE-family HTH domain